MRAIELSSLVLLCVCCLTAQSGISVAINQADAKWEHSRNDPPNAESVTLRDDPQHGGVELIVRYPAGHVFAPHWHSANERIVLLEGHLRVEVDGKTTVLDPGGYAFLPARKVQKLACVSAGRCAFYIHWDGRLDFHREPPTDAPAK